MRPLDLQNDRYAAASVAALTTSLSAVASHVGHILAKLGGDRRAEIAAWGVRYQPEA